MNWSAGGTSWLEGLSAFGVLASFAADRLFRRRRSHRRERERPDQR